MSKFIDTKALKEYLIAGLGGGAVHAITDGFLTQWLSGYGAIAGMSVKDVALILLAQYGARKTKGMIKTSLDGMGIIGVYKVLYPQFIAPIVSGVTSNMPVAAGSPITATSNGYSALDML